MNLDKVNLLMIRPYTDKKTPFVVKDIRGEIVFYAKYEHEALAFVRGVQFAQRQEQAEPLGMLEVKTEDGFHLLRTTYLPQDELEHRKRSYIAMGYTVSTIY